MSAADSPRSGRWTADVVVGRLRAAGCVYAEDEARLLMGSVSSTAALGVLVERRVSGIPLEHVLGWADFCGVQVQVDAGVFVPRPRTELLVRQAGLLARRGDVVLDLCCGSGAVGAALRHLVGDVTIHAVDLDPAAVACARRNLAGPRCHVHLGGLYAPLPEDLQGHVHLVVANAPYVPTDEVRLMPPEARLHEPRAALDGGADGLTVVRDVLAGAAAWLAPGGHVLVETSRRQVAASIVAATDAGFEARAVVDDELDAVVLVATDDRVPARRPSE